MDFNTGGGSGRPDDRPLYGEGAGGPARGSAPGPAGSPGGEFNLQVPINSFVGTVRAVVLDPVGFFRGIARRGDFVSPLVFALICAVLNAVLSGIIGFFFLAGDPDFGVGGAFAGLIWNIILIPILTVIGLFIMAGLFHLLVLLFVRPANAGFEANFRVASYASVALLVGWIPIIGFILLVVGYAILSVLGIREVHTTTTGKAALVSVISVVVFLLLLIVASAVLAFLLFFLLGSQQQF